MGKYILTLKGKNEIIHSHLTYSLMLAIEYFAQVKKLDVSSLLNVFEVKKVK